MLKRKMKPLCEATWIERHTALTDFLELYEPLLDCLATVGNAVEKKWASKTKTEANGLLYQIQCSEFIVAFHTSVYVFGYTKIPSQSLQGSSMDFVNGYNHVKTATSELQKVCNDAKETFRVVYSKAEVMATASGVTISVPRVCGQQTMPNNVQAQDVITHYRRSVSSLHAP
jgi:hypothetical protein